MIEVLLGAVTGAFAGGAVSWFLNYRQTEREKRERLAQGQFDLLRRIARHKGGNELGATLNEVPILFARDKKALDLYKKAVRGTDADRGSSDALVELVEHLARVQGLPVDREFLAPGFAG
jgi:hypothetical protein